HGVEHVKARVVRVKAAEPACLRPPGQVPKPDSVVAATRDHRLAVRREHDGLDSGVMACGEKLLAGAPLPEVNGIAPTTGRQDPPVARKREGTDLAASPSQIPRGAKPREPLDLLAGGQIPDGNHIV